VGENGFERRDTGGGEQPAEFCTEGVTACKIGEGGEWHRQRREINTGIGRRFPVILGKRTVMLLSPGGREESKSLEIYRRWRKSDRGPYGPGPGPLEKLHGPHARKISIMGLKKKRIV